MSNPNGGRNFRNPRWTPEDDARVLATQTIQDRQALARTLGRSYGAVTQRRVILCNAQRAGKAPPRRSNEMRAEAVRRYRAGGISYREVDRQLGLPPGNTRVWVLDEDSLAARATLHETVQASMANAFRDNTPPEPQASTAPTPPTPTAQPWTTVVTGRGLHLTGVAHFVLTGGPQGLTAKVTFT